jgi:hypothetical protein
MQNNISKQKNNSQHYIPLYIAWLIVITCLLVGEFTHNLILLSLGYYSSIIISFYSLARWLFFAWPGRIALIFIFLCFITGISMKIPFLFYSSIYVLIILAAYGLAQWLLFTWPGRIVLLLAVAVAGYWYYTSNGGQLPF